MGILHTEWNHFGLMSYRLVLLPRLLEVQATVLPALDDRPPAAGRLHVAIHLHRGERST